MSKILEIRHFFLFAVALAFGLVGKTTYAQTPFVCDNTLHQTVKNPNGNYEFYEIQTNPVQFNLQQILGPITGHGVNALAYNPEDNFIYAVSAEVITGHRLYRIDANYNMTDLGAITGLPVNIGTALGGAIDKDGNYYITLHKWAAPYATAGSIYRLDISTLNATFIMNYSDYITDFAVDPFTGKMYGVDVDGGLTSEPNQLKEIDPLAGTVTVIGNTPTDYGSVASMFFDSKGELYGYAVDTRTAATGAEMLVRIDKATAVFTDLGPATESAYSDGCSCAFGFEMDKSANVSEIGGGDTLEYTITIYNASGLDASNVSFYDSLEHGLVYVSEPYDLTGGIAISSPGIVGDDEGQFTLTTVPDGSSSFKVDVLIPTNYSGPEMYPNMATLRNLPVGHPVFVPSDEPSTPAIDDSTYVCIRVDSIAYPPGEFCQSSPDIGPTIYGPVGGVFSVNPVVGLDIDANGLIDLSESQAGTYTITYTAGVSCANSVATQLTIYEDVFAGTGQDQELCASAGTYDLSSALSGFVTPGGTWIDVDNSGALSGSTLNLNTAGYNMTSGFDFIYAVQNGVCVDSSFVNVKIDSVVNAGTGANITICLTENALDLHDLLTGEDSNGSWTDLDGTSALTGSVFDATQVTPGSYDFRYTLTGDICPDDSETITVTVADTVHAGDLLNDGVYELCDDVTDQNLFDLLDGTQDPGGVWKDVNASGGLYDDSLFDATVVALGGTYNFDYVVSAVAPCPDDSVRVTILVIEDPNAGDSTDTDTLCNVGDSPIDLDDFVFPVASGGGIIWKVVNAPAGPLAGTFVFNTGFFDPTGNEPGQYQFRKVVENCGQKDSIDVFIEVSEGRDADGDGLNNHYEGQLTNRDTDGDGILDYLDMDSDNDGIMDADEAGTQNDPCAPAPRDVDGDGVADYLDLDSDGDGIFDLIEGGTDGDVYDQNDDGVIDDAIDVGNNGLADDLETGVDSGDTTDDPSDSDGDGIPDHLDLDSDNDGITDIVESGGSGDNDGDGIIDDLTDTDGDGVADGQDNTDGHGNIGGDTSEDTDGDGLNDHVDLDSDNDGILDIIETGGTDSDNDGEVDNLTDNNNDGLDDDPNKVVTDPVDTDGDGNADYLDLDSDNDGLTDIIESGGSDSDGNGTVDNFTDADNDGKDDNNIADNPNDTDGDGIVDHLDLDSDNDGLADVVEGGNGDLDTNNDGVLDGADGVTEGNNGLVDQVDYTESTDSDTDGDGLIDAVDLDSDNDGMSDVVESGNEALDTNNDGVLDDADGVTENGDGLVDQVDYNDTADSDTDGDGILDAVDLDSDNDGLADVIEGGNGDLDTNNDGVLDDADGVTENGDGLVDQVDYDESADNDTDGDGINDAVDLDSDNDGIADVVEGGNGALDTNEDGVLDDADGVTENGDGLVDQVDYDETADSDTDGDGILDAIDLDSDNDGIADVVEGGNGDLDTNNDGVLDGDDGVTENGDGLVDQVDYDETADNDTDGDGINDAVDLDSDNDGIADVVEGGNGALDTNEDGVLDDADGITENGDGLVDQVDYDDSADNDTDGDGINDAVDLDSDNDGIADVVEGGNGDLDTNNDGVLDGDDGVTENGDGLVDQVDYDETADNDTDGDGINDAVDLDSDNDGIADVVEGGNGSLDTNNDGVLDGSDGVTENGDGLVDQVDYDDSADNDTDGDGINDAVDLDSDNDGIADVVEGGNGSLDTNNDGVLDDADGITENGDGLVDQVDYEDSSDSDTDGDGLIDAVDLDSDNDGLADVVEGGNGSLDTNNDGVLDGDDGVTENGDGLIDQVDYDDSADSDTDGDGINDAVDLDSDNDGIADVVEGGNGALDTNEDGVLDDADGVTENGDGLVDQVDYEDSADSDTDGDGILDAVDLDSDNDGLSDVVESGNGDLDSNNDGVLDDADGVAEDEDGLITGVDYNETADGDTDGDGLIDAIDLDSDNDGISDVVESGNGSLDTNNDGVLDDADGVTENEDGLINEVDYEDSAESDSDGDGIIDAVDLDSDNDGLTDVVESGNGDLDTNNDGVLDGDDGVTENNDGLINEVDYEDTANSDTDGDGHLDAVDLDSDNDGIADVIESGGSDDNGDGKLDDFEDANGDGLNDDSDTIIHDPVDTDGDGQADHLDLDSDNDAIKDIIETGGNDDDNDGMIDADDFQDANNDGMDDDMVTELDDFDGDGIADVHDLDSDNDGISDIVESGNGDLDTNNDGLLDDPNADTDSPLDSDGDGQNNNVDLDSDNDSISDLIESGNEDAMDNDQDGDGMIDDNTDDDGDGIADVIDGTDGAGGLDNSDLVNTDGEYTDGNGDDDPDYIDVDSDGDGIFDVDEVGNGNLDSNNDGIIDDVEDQDNDGIADVVDSNPNGTGGAEDNTEDVDGDGIFDHMDIEILDPEIPQGFSPNGDGVNDVFVITRLGPFDKSTLKIYNRWGNLVYKSHAYRNDWDGNYNRHAAKFQAKVGTKVPAGTYYYIFEQGSTENVAGRYAEMPDKVKTGYIYISY